jgi:adhesin transport system membrane fusion protein
MAIRSEDLDFMPDVYAATLRRGSRVAYIMTFVILLFIVVFFVWSYFAVLDEVTRGDGRVIPSSKTQVIQNLEGGILADILVQEGDIVEPGDILVRIDNSIAKASFRDARSQFLSLTATVERLMAELEDRPMELPESVLRDAPTVASDEQALYQARQNQFAAEIAILQSQIEQRQQEVAEAQSR